MGLTSSTLGIEAHLTASFRATLRIDIFENPLVELAIAVRALELGACTPAASSCRHGSLTPRLPRMPTRLAWPLASLGSRLRALPLQPRALSSCKDDACAAGAAQVLERAALNAVAGAHPNPYPQAGFTVNPTTVLMRLSVSARGAMQIKGELARAAAPWRSAGRPV